jgi:alpha-methylacyl-CoA racemase
VTGPLAGVRVLEIASIGPGPFCAMVLADLGAEVTRVERVGDAAPGAGPPGDPLLRNRAASIALDLKHPDGVAAALRLAEASDVLVEGFRPGVLERLGLGPETLLERNPRLVVGRMTGWGQDGPRRSEAGHDIDYIALTGVLSTVGEPGGPPVPPLNLVGDFGGGGLLLAFGVVAALVARQSTGAGQVVDAAMVDGSALLSAMLHGMRGDGLWVDERGSNLLDGGAPFYTTYRTADERWMAVGALEPKFFAALLEGLEIDPASLPAQYDRSGWSRIRERLAAEFATRSRDDWADRFTGTDACVAPVLDPGEAPSDPHLAARGTFVQLGGVTQPAPAPRFGATPATEPRPGRAPGEDTDAVLADLGYSHEEIASLRAAGAAA